MISDAIKVAIKTALVVGVLVALAILILNINVPTVNVGLLTYYINKIYSIAIHWCPVIRPMYDFALTVISLNITALLYRAGLFAYKTLMTIFE